MSDTHLSDKKFDQFNIHPKLLEGIAASGFEYCTPIQAMCLPAALEGKDVSGQAQTGTGKTAAFLIAAMNHLLNKEARKSEHACPIRTLILAPTRELAIQIYEDGKPLAKHSGLKLGIAYGGTDYEKQRTHIEKGIDILVGTPGRVIDYFKQGVFSMDTIDVIVLDEADRMFDLGFIADIRYLFRRMPAPETRLNMLFSATLSHRVSELAYEHMNEPEVIKIESEAITADRITEKGYMPANEEKIPLLLGLVKELGSEKVVIFLNTKHQAEKVQAWLNENGFPSALLSGDVPQRKRETLLNSFKSGKITVLVATDVAARGLHIPDVSCVINYDLPTDSEDYVHRIGRTARAGAKGTAISLICETYAMSLMDIEQYIEHAIPVEKSFGDILFKDPVKPDLSKLRSNRKTSPKDARKLKPAQQRQRPEKSKEKPHKRNNINEVSPEQKDARRADKLEQKVKKAPRMPLRGRRSHEVPAVG